MIASPLPPPGAYGYYRVATGDSKAMSTTVLTGQPAGCPSDLDTITRKVEAGDRLTREDGLTLERLGSVNFLGELANLVRERKNGDVAWYNVNVHLNPTNVCAYRCTFCAFRADLKDPKAYRMSDDNIRQRAAEARKRGCTEMHIVGGLHNKMPYEWYRDILVQVREENPRIHLKAYTAVEWDWFSRITGSSTAELLAEFQQAGLGSLPGGGAEIFDPVIRGMICEHKADGASWLRIHEEAHRLGLRSNATMRVQSTVSTTCWPCATCRTGRVASRHSSRSLSIPTTPAWRICPSHRASWTCG